MKITPYKKINYKEKTFIFYTEIIGLDFDDKIFDKIIEKLPSSKEILVKVINSGKLEVFSLAGTIRKPKKIILDKKLKI